MHFIIFEFHSVTLSIKSYLKNVSINYFKLQLIVASHLIFCLLLSRISSMYIGICASLTWNSYASSSRLYPCEWVKWAELRTSVATRLVSLFHMCWDRNCWHLSPLICTFWVIARAFLRSWQCSVSLAQALVLLVQPYLQWDTSSP